MRERKDRKEIVKLYVEEKLSTPQIAKKLNSTAGAIASCLTHSGIKLRSSSEGLKTRYPNGRKGKESANWKGGLRPIQGYLYRYSPNHPFKTKKNYVMEHRLVMEKYLGRYLKPTEFVHHIDGNKKNNKIENLKLAKNKREHSKFHFDAVKEVRRLRKILKENNILF